MKGRLLRPTLLLVFLVQQGLILGPAKPAGRADAGWTLGPRKHLRSGVDLWPMIVAPRNAASEKVNSAFMQMNRDVVDQVRECDADWAASQEAWGEKPKGRGVQEKGDWEQKIKLTMNGPRFLSFTVIDFNVCNHSYPNTSRLAFVFDMQSGDSVDWTNHIAEYADAARSDNVFSFPALQEINSHSAVGECKDAFAGEQFFVIWPDARRGSLNALATGLPHVVQGCAEEIVLTLDQARKLGFKEDVLGAIEEAHRRGLAVTDPRQSSRHPTN